MDFFFFFLPPSSFLSFFFFLLLLQTSPLIFPGIKNPFWIIHSILNLAGTCIHNKLNLPRRFWDLPRTCRWQTTKILFFFFFFFKAATGRATPARVPEGRKTDAALSFFLFPSLLFRNEYWHWVPVISSVTFIGVFIRQTLGAVFMPQQRPATPLNCHPRLAPKQSEVESHFLMVTQAMRPGNWTVGGSLSAHHMTCLKSL